MIKVKFLFIFSLFLFFSCGEDPIIVEKPKAILDLPEIPHNYSNIQFPNTFTEYVFSFDNTPTDNQMTDEGATLGRVLFYDKKLSFNNTISCASCHLQEFGFADGKEKSIGFEDGLTRRNSIGFANVRFYKDIHFFWDYRAGTLEEQVLMPIQDPVEMGMTLEGVVEKIAALEYYNSLFEDAFGSEIVTSDKIAKALAQFVRSIYSFDSKYDEGIQITGNIFLDFPNFTAQENMGKDVFNGKLTPEAIGTCATCHLPNAFPLHFTNEVPGNSNQVILSGSETHNIGLDAGIDVDDNGEGEFFNIPALYGHFKTSSLRNIELTAPYMHDGRFATLEEVVEHYSKGVEAHPTLSGHMKNGEGEPRLLDLTDEEADALVAFMKTFTDYELINDKKFSDPFVE